MQPTTQPQMSFIGFLWSLLVVVIAFGILFACTADSPEEAAKKIRAEKAQAVTLEKEREARERNAAIVEAGLRSRDEFDAATRDNTAERRKTLEKASRSHTMNAPGYGPRIDTYRLKSGRTVICSTSIAGPGPAIMKCDGEP